MRALLAAALLAMLAGFQQAPTFRVQLKTLQTSDGKALLYGRAIPGDYDPKRPRPLVLALHPAGDTTSYHGAQYMRSVFLPGLRDLDPIMVAPDCPARAWSDPVAEKAVMALIDNVLDEYAVDRRRILVVGFSLGGRGTWFMESRHPDLFTAAIVMAGETDEPFEDLGKIRTYVIHSRNDQIVPFAQAEQRASALERMGRPVKFDALDGLGHFDMGGYVPALVRAARWVAAGWDISR